MITSDKYKELLIEHFTEHLDKLRQDNDSKMKDAIETAFLRGRIKEAKEFLKILDNEKFEQHDLTGHVVNSEAPIEWDSNL